MSTLPPELDSNAPVAEPGVSIPGKVMLSGEYAVLSGGTAVLIPVPRHLKLTRSDSAPLDGYSPMLSAARNFPVIELESYEREHGTPEAGIDAGEFYGMDALGAPLKLGLGLSAAEAVGMLALRCESAGIDWRGRRAELARWASAAHQQAQGGRGSGADVAACVMQQPIVYRLDPGHNTRETAPLWRDAGAGRVPLALLWSGVAADTRALLVRFEHWVTDNHDSAPHKLAELIRLADETSVAWRQAPLAELFAALDAWDCALSALLNAAGVPYRLPFHARLEKWALRHGGRAKPTGGGGGDMVLLIGDLPLSQLAGLLIELDPL